LHGDGDEEWRGVVDGGCRGAAHPPLFLSLSLFSLSPSLSLSMLCRHLGLNQLTGTIPSQLAELTGLTIL
jgi:hypothetical protein